MTKVCIYDIVMEDGTRSVQDVVLSMNEDFNWVDVFEELDKIFADSVESYSYKEVVCE
jgi:hypothetical protein